MPLFSVIIPTFNRCALLAQTLASVWTQRFADFEVIIVDDGSTDATGEWLRGIPAPVRVLLQANRGAGAARNLGIKQATGRYAAFLDSDDVWFPWTLSTYARAIQQYGEPCFLTGSPFVFTSIEQLEQVNASTLTATSFPDYYASSDAWRWFSASSLVVRRDCLEAVGGFHEAWGSEDADLAMMLGTERGFVHITTPYAFGYRDQPQSLKTMPTYALSGGKLMLLKEKNGKYPGGTGRRRNRLEILTRHIRPVSLDCLREGMREDAWELYRATFGWHLRLGRWRYLSGFPVLAARAKIRAGGYTASPPITRDAE